MKRVWCTFLWLTLLTSVSFAQTENEKLDPDTNEILTLESPSTVDATGSDSGINYVSTSPFEKLYETQDPQVDLKRSVALKLDVQSLNEIYSTGEEFVSLVIPTFGNAEVTVELAKWDILTDDFTIVTSESNGQPLDVNPGHFYQGVLKGNPNSTAAFSIFEGQIIGMITVDGSNIVLIPHESRPDEYIMYDDKDIEEKNPFSCSALDHPEMSPAINTGYVEVSNCVEVYLECDHALYLNKGSVTATTNWITAVFNNMATLYGNESINTAISQIYIWTTPDNYSTSSSYSALTQFRANNPSFNGDIAHLAALGGNNIGGIAWLDVLCSSYAYAYSNINATYANVPTYSWTIEVMTHEMGHNLGSRHTQWCGWPGGAIDNCYTPEGTCAPGPPPTSGGTIMSYCHLTGYGINFNNGFGTHPGDKIRAEVAAASCLGTSCGGGGGGCNVPTGLVVSSITQTSASASWNSVSGAISYDFEYKLATATTWTRISTTSTSYSLTGLTASTTYNTRVRTVCSGSTSNWSSVVNFTTAGTTTYCSSSANSCSQEWIRRVKLNSMERLSGCDGGYYDGTHLSTTLYKGGYTPIYFRAGRTGGSRRFYWRVWVDLNDNGSFGDAGELLVSGYSNSTGNLYAWLYVPSSAANGLTRMRVSMRYGGYPPVCGTFSRGEVEDYTVDIRATGTLEENVNVTGVKDSYKLYPNPTSDFTRLEFESPTDRLLNLTLVDMTGRPVRNWDYKANSGFNFIEVDLSILNTGAYFLRIDNGDEVELLKLFKQ